MKRCRSSSFENRLIPQAIDCAEWGESASGGPNIITAGHHQRFDGVLRHGVLLSGPAKRQQQLETLPLVEALLLADPDHGAPVGPVGAAGERDLVHDGGAVDEPADGAHVRPGERRVVEDGGVSLPAGVQEVEQVVAGDAEGLGGPVEVEPMPGLVLHLGDENGLALEGGRSREPVRPPAACR